MSGRDGARGYLYQALAALVESLDSAHLWSELTIEPDFESEKIDIRWTGSNGVKAVQVKSSINLVTIRELKAWATELESSVSEVHEFELIVFGNLSSNASKFVQHGNVRIVTKSAPSPDGIQAIIEQSAHRLNEYFASRNPVKILHPSHLKKMVEWLTLKLFVSSTYGTPLLRQQFETWLSNTAEDFKDNEQPELLDFTKVFTACEQISSMLTMKKFRGQWLERPQLGEIQQAMVGTDKITFLLGLPGSGKTAILAKIVDDLLSQNSLVLGFRADRIPIEEDVDAWLGQQLGHELGFRNFILQTDQFETITVVIDQVDALADLVDLNSNRLNEVLNLVRFLGARSNIRIVCSCREFEYRHDVRLNGLDSKVIRLELPTWDQVQRILHSEGIAGCTEWPSEFKELLRTPQHLTIYLDAFRETGRAQPFDSYQQMLDELWRRKINSDRISDLVYELTEQLIKRESLSLPLVLFETRRELLKHLEAEQIVFIDGVALGFKHQTLLEHAKARLFTRNDKPFSQFVIERQHSIAVRPTVWAVLRYLRAADRAKYHTDINALSQSTVRLHVRFLLVDFLGQVDSPDLIEQQILASYLNDLSIRRRVLISIRGNKGWFQALHARHFPVVMRWEHDQWPMIDVISAAWSDAHKECLHLVKEHWLSDASKDDFTWRVLDTCQVWDEQIAKCAKNLIGRSSNDDQRDWIAERLTSRASDTSVDLAIELFLVSEDLAKKATSPLENSDWYELPRIAEKDSVTFLQKIWPWFLACGDRFYSQPMSTVLNRYGGSMSLLDQEPVHRERSIIDALIAAIEKVGRSRPDVIVEIANASLSSESMLVHALVLRGMRFIVKTDANFVLDYLAGDNRRLAVGASYSGDFSESCNLISVLSNELDKSQISRLTRIILNCSHYKDQFDMSQETLEFDRGYRLQLLHAISSVAVTSELKEFINAEKTQLPDWERPYPPFGRSYFYASPMSKEDMKISTDAEIIAALQLKRSPNPYDSEEWCETENAWRLIGGGYEATGTLVTLVSEEPNRALRLIPQLVTEKLFEACGRVAHALSDSNESYDDVIGVMRRIDWPTALPDSVRSDFSYLLYKLSFKAPGLPTDMISLLKQWLFAEWKDYGPIAGNIHRERNDQIAPIIWSTRDNLMESGPQFWSMHALSEGLLRQKPPNTADWLQSLSNLIETPISLTTWLTFCRELKWIKLDSVDKNKGLQTLFKLLQKFPDLPFEHEGINLISDLARVLPVEYLQQYLRDLKTLGEFRHLQGYGELLALLRLRNPEWKWLEELFEKELTALGLEIVSNEPMAIGMAYIAAKGWDESSFRHPSWLILKKLIPVSTSKSSLAISTVFFCHNDFLAENDTEELLKSFANHPECIHDDMVSDVIIAAKEVAVDFGPTVLQLCQSVLAKYGTGISVSGARFHEIGPNLVDIAMTLQRLPSTREGGLVVLEELLQLGLDDAFQTLNELDLRPFKSERLAFRERRRRR